MRLQMTGLCTASLLALTLAAAAGVEKPPDKPRTRAEFAAAMAQVKVGMPKAEVLRLLGPPDDIRTQADLGQAWYAGTTEFWCYGAPYHLAFPTLGAIGMGREQVGFVRPHYGAPPDSAIVAEAELRTLLPLLDTAPGLSGGSYDPLKLIKIVNRLQPLGKQKGAAVIAEFLRVAPAFSHESHEAMFLVMRMLFDVPAQPGYHPRLVIGAAFPEPLERKLAPRFPLAMVDDIPLLQVRGYTLVGMGEPPEYHLDLHRNASAWRSTMLRPTDRPLEALDKLEKSPQWTYSHGLVEGWDNKRHERRRILPVSSKQKEAGRQMARAQLARLVGSVYRLPAVNGRSELTRGCDEGKRERVWQRMVVAVRKLNIRWSVEKNCYVFPDGTHLPERPATK